jgi:hypothetical protein
MTNITMDSVGAPPELWLLCMTYVIYILNRLENATLNEQTPIYVGFGTTPDIIALLLFNFSQHILFHENGASFPNSKENSGRFVGIAENFGDALEFLVLTDDTHGVIGRSDIRIADDPLDPNQRVIVTPVPNVSADRESESKIFISTDGKVPVFTPLDIIAITYLRELKVDGSIYPAKVVEEATDNLGIDENSEPMNICPIR